LVFLDEAGFLMAPLVRRGWRPRTCPAVLHQRTRAHQKVSVIAALCVAPGRDAVRMYFRLHPNANVNSAVVIAFLRVLRKQLGGPFILVWDGLQAHRSRRTLDFIDEQEDIHVEPLPPYAPELNPVEYAWSYLKMNPLANLAAPELDVLAKVARRAGRSVQRKPRLLRSFLAHSPLSLRLK
jgi:transposase